LLALRGEPDEEGVFWKQHRLAGHCQPKLIGGYRRS
jgi:hypothetical protein